MSKGNFAGKKWSVDLSNKGGIFNAMSRLIEATTDKDVLQEKTETLITKLVEEGKETAKNLCPKDTGNLANSIQSNVETKGSKVIGKVYTNETEYAAFVEFGTGVVGQGTYPGDTQGWEYNVPTKYKDETGGWWYGSTYTHGNKAKPFMYNTARFMKDRAESLAKEVLK